jgi:hypothetical protein
MSRAAPQLWRISPPPDHAGAPAQNPTTTVRGTLDQAAYLLPAVLGLLTPTRDICRWIMQSGVWPSQAGPKASLALPGT